MIGQIYDLEWNRWHQITQIYQWCTFHNFKRYPRVTMKQSLWNDLVSSIFIIRRRSPHHPSKTCADTNNKGKKRLRTCHCLKRLRSGCYINGCFTHTIHRYTVTFPQSHCTLRDWIPTMKVGYDVGFCIQRLFKFKWDLSIYYVAFDWKTLLV